MSREFFAVGAAERLKLAAEGILVDRFGFYL